MNRPKISIITVTYNVVDTVEQTIISVINQTYDNIEYIIIDGGSKDGSIDIIKKYSYNINYWVSEPDNGIYDAMNKGIKIASGDWINFMNAGDIFYNTNTLENIFIHNNIINSDVIYGDRISKYSFGSFYHKADNLNMFHEHFPLFHQSTFIKSSIIKKHPFELKYKICADYNQLYNLYKKEYIFTYIPISMSICECENGVSTITENQIKRMREDEIIVYGYIRKKTQIKFLWLRIKNTLRPIVKFIYPSKYSTLKQKEKLINDPRISSVSL